jgi:hypothetical protein
MVDIMHLIVKYGRGIMGTTFERKEIKYLITIEQKNDLFNLVNKHMVADKYSNSLIKNIYYDTPDRLLIRRSLEKPIFKEKLRIRAYGSNENEKVNVFLELKKKYKGIVYKRRIELDRDYAMSFMETNGQNKYDNQILNEVSYFKKIYKGLAPSVYLSYVRQAYFGNDDSNFRLTFDENILIRDYDISLNEGPYGIKVIPEDKVIVEVKTLYGIPTWLIEFFEQNDVYKTSFSKYGMGYKLLKTIKDKEEKNYVA